MVVPPDSDNPPTASAAGEHLGSDLTLNAPTSAADVDAVPDLRLEPEVDSSSTLAPEHVPLEQRDSVQPGGLTQAPRPHVHIFWTPEADRSWLSRLRTLKASLEKELLVRSAHDEPVTTEADTLGPAARTGDAERSWLSRLRSSKASGEKQHLVRSAHDDLVTTEAFRNLEKHLASLAALRDVCASIDQRLARVEQVSGQRDGATIDEALHDLCSQIYDRLVRVEAAAQRTEGFVPEKPWDLSTIADQRLERVEETLRLTHQSLADSPVPGMCANIERELVQARTALQRTEEAVADKTLYELCKNIDARLERTEDTLHRNEGTVAEWLQPLSAHMTARFAEAEETIQRLERERVEETLRLTQQSLADSMLPDTCANIERHLVQARMVF